MGLVRPVRQVGLVGLARRLCEKAGPWGRAEYSLTMHTESEGPLLPHGGYRKMRSYKVAQAVYDATVVFCRRFFAQDRRMTDQMVQAARSGVRNISEGSGSAATSRKTEMKLTNVARSSLSDELLRDYESFLTQHGLRVWPKESREALAMRKRLAQDYAPALPPVPGG